MIPRQRKLVLVLKEYWDRENKAPTTHYLAVKVDACDVKVHDDLYVLAGFSFVALSKRALTRRTPGGNQNSIVLEAKPTPAVLELLPRIEQIVAMDELVNRESRESL
jgi:hypothetical protein